MENRISFAALEQIKYWSSALRQANKAIRRKNKRINSLQRNNLELKGKVAFLMLRLAENNTQQSITLENNDGKRENKRTG